MIENPFRGPARREQFDRVVRCYEERGKLLFGSDGHRALNSWAANFWAGFDGMTRGVRVPDVASAAWPIYRAGQAIRKALAEGVK